MEFKVGDRVKIIGDWSKNMGMIGEIQSRSRVCDLFEVTIDDTHFGLYNDYDLELVTDEETNTKFKVGDKVRITWSCSTNKDKEGVISEDDGSVIPYKVTLDDGEVEWKHGNHIIKLEEKVMKFKVGDKVKVSNSWEGRSGEVGEITRRNIWEAYPCRVTFEDGVYESFKEEEIELVKEKQQFTKSDLKTGMGVVLRDGDKGHVLLGTEAGDVIRLIDGDNHQWMSTEDYDSEMCDSDMERLDIMEVYSSKLAYSYVTDRLFTHSNLVFKREEPKPEPTKMTMKEINEHFGKSIEIVE